MQRQAALQSSKLPSIPQSCPADLQTAQQFPKLICSLQRCPAVPKLPCSPPICPSIPQAAPQSPKLPCSPPKLPCSPPICPSIPKLPCSPPKLPCSAPNCSAVPPSCPAVHTAFQADLYFGATALSLIHFICDTPNSSDVSRVCYNLKFRVANKVLYFVLYQPTSRWQPAQ